MALTKISRGLLNTGVSDSSDATAITIDSSERVMIGTTDPGYPDYGDSLTLGDVDGGGGNAGMTIRSGTSSYGTFYFSDATGTAAGTYAGKMQYNHSTNSMVFATNSSDRLTIDSSGNVGIGTTSPVATLQVKTQTNGNLAFQNSTSVTGGVKLNCFNDAANASSPFEIDGSSLQFNIAASEKMRIDSSGNVGIGTASPADLLHLVSSAPMLKVEATNDSSGFRIDVLGQSSGQAFRVLKDTSTTLFTVDTSGNVTAAGSISDERLKEDISLIDNPLDKIKELKGITYKLKESGYIGTGLIAQDLQKVLPEAVYEVNEPEKNDESYLAISYGNTVGLLVESIKEQQVIIEDLQTQINEVKNGN